MKGKIKKIWYKAGFAIATLESGYIISKQNRTDKRITSMKRNQEQVMRPRNSSLQGVIPRKPLLIAIFSSARYRISKMG